MNDKLTVFDEDIKYVLRTYQPRNASLNNYYHSIEIYHESSAGQEANSTPKLPERVRLT